MTINWFPGHMAAARRKVAEAMAQIDVVVEVLDARIPGASANPMLTELRLARQRPALKLLNKADLADPAVTAAWLRTLEDEARATRGPPVRAVALSCRKAAEVARVPRLAAALAPHRGGMEKPLRLFVLGIPNVGKSTLVNALLKRRIAKVGDEPAVTKQVQRYELPDRVVLFDSPGLMWPSIARASDGLMLAASHAIGINAYVDLEVAQHLAEILRTRYPEMVGRRYACEPGSLDATGIIEAVARARNLRLKDGTPDLDRAASVLLVDYRNGTLGRISLETPVSRSQADPRSGTGAEETA